MRTTVTIDDKLLEDAKEISGIKETSALVKQALTQLVHREASRQLAAMGGTEPNLVTPPRRRFPE
nr:type II toxin-antitoxin system VapB family antitoxin [uncultured Devosia sp.]